MNNFNVLNRFFSKSMLLKAIENNQNSCFGELVKRYSLDETLTNQELISSIYSIMGNSYRNEYFYKNTLLNNLIVKKHKLNSTKVITELPIGKSIADFITINGKAVVYEIKTELDNLERIETQIQDYYKCFPYVCIVTCEKHLKKVKNLFISTSVGIYSFSSNNSIKVIKEPVANFSQLDYSTMFKVLRKYEFEEVLTRCSKTLPQTTQFEYYRQCLNLFKSIDLKELYAKMLIVLKQRCVIEIEEFDKVPLELKMLVYQTQLTTSQYKALFEFLHTDYLKGGCSNVFPVFEG